MLSALYFKGNFFLAEKKGKDLCFVHLKGQRSPINFTFGNGVMQESSQNYLTFFHLIFLLR
jgi:hypothetical protein